MRFLAMFSYPFMVRAFAAGGAIALCAALLGVPLVLRRFAMLGDGLSHVGFGAMAAAAAVGLAPLPVAVVVVVIAALLMLRPVSSERRRGGGRGDATVASISVGALAVGMLILSRGGSDIDVSNYMFGSVLSLGTGETVFTLAVCTVVLIGVSAAYRGIFAVTFDADFAAVTLPGGRLGSSEFLAASAAAVTVLGMRIAVVTFWAGLTVSYMAGGTNIPAGACIVTIQLALYLASAAAGKLLRRGSGMPAKK